MFIAAASSPDLSPVGAICLCLLYKMVSKIAKLTPMVRLKTEPVQSVLLILNFTINQKIVRNLTKRRQEKSCQLSVISQKLLMKLNISLRMADSQWFPIAKKYGTQLATPSMGGGLSGDTLSLS